MMDSYRSFMQLLWIYNDGQGNFSDHWHMDCANVTYGSVNFGDLDNDDDSDVFVCNGDNSGNNFATTILLNDGSGRFSDSGQVLAVTSFGEVGRGDFDGNGSLDAFISNFGLPNQVWMDEGACQFLDSGLRLSGIINDNTTHVSLGDFDNDAISMCLVPTLQAEEIRYGSMKCVHVFSLVN